MKLTSFGFVAMAESFLKDALSSPPLGGGSWKFQRSVNFNERTGTLQIVLTNSAGLSKTKASVHARQIGTAKDYSIQGWTEVPEQDKRTNFVLKASNPVRIEEEVFEIVDRLLTDIPERDESVVIERPAAPIPKATFAPLIPELQTAPAEPEPAAESGPSADSFDSTQSFVDALLSPDSFDKGPIVEEPAVEAAQPVEEEFAPVEEPPAPVEPEAESPKAKASKSKKAAK